MTKQSSLKRLGGARMAKTGESYTAALASPLAPSGKRAQVPGAVLTPKR